MEQNAPHDQADKLRPHRSGRRRDADPVGRSLHLDRIGRWLVDDWHRNGTLVERHPA